MPTQEIIDFTQEFRNKYYLAMFCEIGYHAIRGGGYTWYLSGMIGNTSFDNSYFNNYPVFETDIQASEAVNYFCLVNNNFKNRNHIESYDYLPLR